MEKKTRQSTLNKVVANLLEKGWDEKRIKAHLLKKAGSVGNVVYNISRSGSQEDGSDAVKITITVSDTFHAGLLPDHDVIEEKVQEFASQLDSDFENVFGEWY